MSSHSPPDIDTTLVQNVLQGKPGADEAFVTHFRRRIYRVLLSAGIPIEESEDLCQAVFVHLWAEDRRRLRLWSQRGRFTSFLDMVVLRLAIERHREKRPMNVSGQDQETADGNDTEDWLVRRVLTRQRMSALLKAMQQLPGRDAELIRRKHLRGESYDEMAAELRITRNHVGVALHRAEKRLRVLLEQSARDLFE